MDEFNFENASEFLRECLQTGKRTESTRRVLIRLAPQIRELTDDGFTQREVYEMLVEKYGLELSFSTFRGYLRQAAQARETEENGEARDNPRPM